MEKEMLQQDQFEAYLAQMNVPTLVVRSSRNTVVPQRLAEHVTGLLPQGKLVVIEKTARKR